MILDCYAKDLEDTLLDIADLHIDVGFSYLICGLRKASRATLSLPE